MPDNTKTDPPDVIAHTLVANTGGPVRIYPAEQSLTVPTEPYQNSSPATTTVPVTSFDAVIEDATIEDGGLTLSGIGGLHLPEPEWERVGLRNHWEHDAVDLRSPMTDASRKLDIWASREDAYYDVENPDPDSDSLYEHLDAIPDDSPLITEWNPPRDDDPETPPVPFKRPELTLYVLHGEDSDHDAQGFDRVDIGRIAGVEILDEDEIVQWPEPPDIDKRELDISPPSRYPEIDYSSIDPLPMTEEVLAAVHAVNRHAKQFDERADAAYQMRDGAQARVYSIQKKTLYKVKTVAIHRLAKGSPGSVRVKRHVLNGDHEMYCFYVDEPEPGYSFHQPLGAVEAGLLDDVAYDRSTDAEVIDFESSSKTDNLDLSLSDALRILSEHGVDANEYLETTSVKDFEWGHRISTTFDFNAARNH